ncbi:hypothetical protein CERSUDRAFT_119356 [Gelatoporia subvermispora B]|uniref:Cytochrome P450 n=1 Tax=Ceriporiopsis subvermispora (strain B) TaxID=914234 RepID=M2Q4P2_CERS8|nr:hypothetical protein CERSUDRAFT_119356 [Gelatoporia subvermispora B]
MYMTHLNLINAFALVVTVWGLSQIARIVRRRWHTTPLRGPPSPSFLYGIKQVEAKQRQTHGVYNPWVATYGGAFRVAAPMGTTRIVLTDPKAVAHVLSQDTWGYTHPGPEKAAIEAVLGPGILWVDGHRHQSQRKALAPAFSNTAIRGLTSVYFDSAYKVKFTWDSQIQISHDDYAIIDVEDWMNRVSLDTIGIAGFSYDFGTLSGKQAPVADILERVSRQKSTFGLIAMIALAMVFPWVLNIPTERHVLLKRLHASMEDIAQELLDSNRKEADGTAMMDNSIMRLLLKAESVEGNKRMSQEEIISQMKVLIIGGYESTSISITWALIELCRRPDAQERLRKELSQYSSADPTWEDLTHGLPYLDAVVQETLRLHPPVGQSARVAVNDDVVPLSTPVQTAKGTFVDRLHIARGEIITIPTGFINRHEALWGPDGAEFKLERWLEEGGVPKLAQEIKGYRHLLTFWDGPRMCLGRGFALTEFKAVLSVLVRSYTFELPGGPETKFVMTRGLSPRPMVEGQDDGLVPLRVRRVE